MILVFNASPVIVLAKAGLVRPLADLGSAAFIPEAVIEEIVSVDDPADPARVLFEGARLPFQRVATPKLSPLLAGWNLGEGESAVISVAANTSGAVAVLDDLAARRCAQAHGLPMIGTLGLVLLAKRRGMITEASAALSSIKEAGLFISERTLADVRAQAGES